MNFKLHRQLRSSSSWIKWFVVFGVVGILLFGDLIYNAINSANKIKVYVDGSVPITLVDKEEFIFTSDKNEKVDAELGFQNEYRLISFHHLSQQQIEQLKSIISPSLVSLKVQERIPQSHTEILVVITLFYFLAISRGNLISQEIIEEKLTKMTDLLLVSIKPSGHIFAVISYAWASLGMDLLVVILSFFTWTFIRYMYDGFKGIASFASQSSLSFPRENYGLVIMVVILGTSIQRLILALSSARIKRIEETAGIMLVPQILGIFIYYGAMMLYDGSKLKWLTVMAYLPLTNSLAIPLRIVKQQIQLPELALVITILLLYIVIIWRWGINKYGQRLTK